MMMPLKRTSNNTNDIYRCLKDDSNGSAKAIERKSSV